MGRTHRGGGSAIARVMLFTATAAVLIGMPMLSGCGESSGNTAGTAVPADPAPSISTPQDSPAPEDCSTLSDESQDAVDRDSETSSHTISPREQCEAMQYWSSAQLAPWTPKGTGAADDGRLPRVEDAYAADRRDVALSDAPKLIDERVQPIISYAPVATTRLRIYFVGGACDAYRIAIEETDDQVRLGLFAGGESQSGSPCTAQATYASALVTLRAPLGKREVSALPSS